MTSLPALPTPRKLGLVIDLDVCVGCHACVISCKEWNTGGYGAALSDQDPYGADVSGTFLNRIHTFEVVPEGGRGDRRGGRGAHRAFPQILPALRGRALRHRLPDRRLLQARRRRHRAGRRGQVHRLRPVRLGLPLRRARDGSGGRRDEEMHAVHRPHLQRDAQGGRSRAVLRADLPGQCPPLWRSRAIRIRMSRAWWPSVAAST